MLFPSTRFARLSPLALLAALALSAAPAARAQNAPPSLPPIESPSTSRNSVNANSPFSTGPAAADPSREHMMHAMIRARNEERQKQIVSDSQQLLALAKELKEAVDKSNKDELSLDVVNYATEIEKLAKSVKDKMRDGE